MSPSLSSRNISVPLYDKPYSNVCSWNPICDYNKNLIVPEDPPLNDDTMFDQYSSACITNIKQKISLLYKEFYVCDIDTIVGLLLEYGNNQSNMIYKALSEMINDGYIIHDKYGNSGTIQSREIIIYLNPLLDDIIPLQYRINLKPLTLPTINLQTGRN